MRITFECEKKKKKKKKKKKFFFFFKKKKLARGYRASGDRLSMGHLPDYNSLKQRSVPDIPIKVGGLFVASPCGEGGGAILIGGAILRVRPAFW